MISRQISVCITVVSLLGLCSCTTSEKEPTPSQQVEAPATQHVIVPSTPSSHPGQHQAKTFEVVTQGKVFSKSQLDQHYKLYEGYVKKRNEIEDSLKTVDRSNVANVTYSPFRELKIEEIYAHNGSLLHELYFGNLGTSKGMGTTTKKLLAKNFGSVENFKKDILDCASCARGWAITAYCLDDGSLHNFVLETHSNNVPVCVIPILVVDTYEHAYMIDYGIDRKKYLQDLWANINWDVVEARLAKMPRVS